MSNIDRLERLEASLTKSVAGFLSDLRITGKTRQKDNAMTDKTIPTEVAAVLAEMRRGLLSDSLTKSFADKLESALTKAEAVALSEDAGHAMNTALCDFATRWKVDGDYMRCRGCNTPQLAGYADSSFKHAGYCKIKDSAESHPWVTFADLIRPITTPAVPVESTPCLDDTARKATEHMLRGGAIKIEYVTQDEMCVPDGWSGWATQYPGELPKLFGARGIAELNHYPEEGARLIFLVEAANGTD